MRRHPLSILLAALAPLLALLAAVALWPAPADGGEAQAQPRGEWTDLPLATIALDYPASALVAMTERAPDGELRLTVVGSREMALQGMGVDPDTGRGYLTRERAAALLERFRPDLEFVVLDNARLVAGHSDIDRVLVAPIMPAGQYPIIRGIVVLNWPGDHLLQGDRAILMSRLNRIHGTVGPMAMDRAQTMQLRLSCAREMVDGLPCAARRAGDWTPAQIRAWMASWTWWQWALATVFVLLFGPYLARVPRLGPVLVELGAHLPGPARRVYNAIMLPPDPAPDTPPDPDVERLRRELARVLQELGHANGATNTRAYFDAPEPGPDPPPPPPFDKRM